MLQHFRKLQYTFKNVLKPNYPRSERKFGLLIPRAMTFSTDNGKFKISMEGYDDIANRPQQGYIATTQLFAQVSSLQRLIKDLRSKQESNLQVEILKGQTHQQKIEVTKLIQNLKQETIELEKGLIQQSKLIKSSALTQKNIQQFHFLREQSQSIVKLHQKILDSLKLQTKEKKDSNLLKIVEFMEKSKPETEEITRKLKNISLQINQNLLSTNSIIIRLQKQNQQLLSILAMYQKQKKDRQEQQRERQKERQKQKKKQLVVMYLSGICGIAGLVAIYQFYQVRSKENEFLNKFLNKYRKLPIVRYEYVKGSQVQKQINTIFQSYQESQIKMIVGSPGMGKSSGLRQVLKRYKEKESQIFYFTFQSSTSQDDCTESANDLLKFLSDIQNIYKESDFKNKEVKVVIDDINKIDELQNRQFARRIMTKMYGFAYSQSIDLICLSSSSTFVEKFNNNNEYNKSVKTYVLESEHTEEFIHNYMRVKLEERYHKTLKKELKKDEKFWEDFKVVSKQIFSFGFSLRFIQLQICPLISQRLNRMEEAKAQNQTIKALLKQVNAIKLMEQNTDQLKIYKIMNLNFKNSPYSKQMIRKILYQRKSQINNCQKLFSRDNDPQKIQRAIQQLNQKNLIMFCQPRTKKERAAFERFLKR